MSVDTILAVMVLIGVVFHIALMVYLIRFRWWLYEWEWARMSVVMIESALAIITWAMAFGVVSFLRYSLGYSVWNAWLLVCFAAAFMIIPIVGVLRVHLWYRYVRRLAAIEREMKSERERESV